MDKNTYNQIEELIGEYTEDRDVITNAVFAVVFHTEARNTLGFFWEENHSERLYRRVMDITYSRYANFRPTRLKAIVTILTRLTNTFIGFQKFHRDFDRNSHIPIKGKILQEEN
jgi:hypothetical protein